MVVHEGERGKEASSCAHDAKLGEDGAYDATAFKNNVSNAIVIKRKQRI
jgi:hypothetical protein